MDRLQLAGVLWAVAALLAIAATLVFRVDQVQIVVTLAAGLLALALGVVMFLRPSSTGVRLSTFVGAVWVLLYAALAVIQADEIAAWTTDVFLGLVGAAAAFVAIRAPSNMRSTT